MAQKILVVDDNPDMCRMVARILRMFGHEPTCAPDGAAALSSAAAEPPGLVLLDVTMPGMDRFDVLRALRAAPATAAVPVVMLTAMADPGFRERALALGAADYLVKGRLDLAELRQVVDRHARP